MACIGEPISWPRLERHAVTSDPAIAAHLARCPACAQCLTEITGDLVALPGLVLPAPVNKPARWWWFAVPALAAAAIAVMIIRPKEPAHRTNVASIKGGGDVTLALVRDRAGTITEDAATFAPGDRWKVVLTCAPGQSTWVDVSVLESHGSSPDRPLAPARISCGNRVVLPGAFELTGHGANTICVRVGETEPALALPSPGPDVACITVDPE